MSSVSAANTPVPITFESDRFHRRLAHFNRARLSPALGREDWQALLQQELRLKLLEGNFVERERVNLSQRLVDVPDEPDAFLVWFEALDRTGPGQGDSLFQWLAERASMEEMRWFLHQEVAGEAGFEDLVALTQIKFPTQAKLEFARNYWDEMGHGKIGGMHGPMLSRLARILDLSPTPEDTVWEALALGNLMIALAANRRYAYQSVGALGAIELTAPGRAVHVAAGLRRLGLDGKSRLYFELHGTLDVKHSAAWNQEILYSLIAADPRVAKPIGEGALMRLEAGARCFARYRHQLGVA